MSGEPRWREGVPRERWCRARDRGGSAARDHRAGADRSAAIDRAPGRAIVSRQSRAVTACGRAHRCTCMARLTGCLAPSGNGFVRGRGDYRVDCQRLQ